MTRFAKRYGAAGLLMLTIFVLSPMIGGARDLIFELFPQNGVKVLGAALSAVALLVVSWTVARIRQARAWRYAALVVGSLLALSSVLLDAEGGGAKVSVVEKFHLLEYGLLAALLYRGRRHAADPSVLLLPLLWTTLAGTLDEGIQWLVPQRVGEIRDVAINAWSGVIGLLFGLALAPPEGFRPRLGATSRAPLARSAAVTVLALAIFWAAAHSGHWIELPEGGRFRSWHSAEELRAAARARTMAWTVDPPGPLPTWGLEDRFLSEAAAHTMHRNHAWQIGDFRTAWYANRILELRYPPFLDTNSIGSGDPHRFSPEARRELERRGAPSAPADYVSPVFAGRIHPAPPASRVLTLAALVAIGLWLVGGRRDRSTVNAPSPPDEPAGGRS